MASPYTIPPATCAVPQSAGHCRHCCCNSPCPFLQVQGVQAGNTLYTKPPCVLQHSTRSARTTWSKPATRTNCNMMTATADAVHAKANNRCGAINTLAPPHPCCSTLEPTYHCISQNRQSGVLYSAALRAHTPLKALAQLHTEHQVHSTARDIVYNGRCFSAPWHR